MSGYLQEQMEGNNTPCNSPPLKYIDSDNHPTNSDHEDKLPSGGPNDPNNTEDPNSPDGPDSGPNNEPDDDPDPNCLFLHTLHDLSDSLWNLCQPQAAKTKKLKSMNQIHSMELTLRNSKISLYLVTFISVIILMSLLQMKKRFYLSCLTSKDQLLAGLNQVLMTQPTPHIGCGAIKLFLVSLKITLVLMTLLEMLRNPFPSSS